MGSEGSPIMLIFFSKKTIKPQKKEGNITHKIYESIRCKLAISVAKKQCKMTKINYVSSELLKYFCLPANNFCLFFTTDWSPVCQLQPRLAGSHVGRVYASIAYLSFDSNPVNIVPPFTGCSVPINDRTSSKL